MTYAFPEWYAWGVLSIAILYLARHWPIEGPRRRKRFAVLFALSPIFGTAHLVLYSLSRNLIGEGLDWQRVTSGILSMFFVKIHFNVIVFWIIVGVDHAVSYYRRYREGELRAARLETQLARRPCRRSGCSSTRTIETIRSQRPHVVFLDVQMGLSGIDVVEQLGRDAPFTVFVTAYDQYAIKAFERHALDYLLKPFDRQHFDATIERIRGALCRSDLSTRSNLRALVKSWQRTAPARLIVKDGGRIHAIRISDIDWIEAAENDANRHCGKTSVLMRETLPAPETRAPQRFVRIHRSTIVNLNRVREFQSSENGEYHVTLESGIRLALSRTYKRRLISLLRH